MRCSGCGKDIPFSGTVCPYCQRDKSKDQAQTAVALVFGLIVGAIGYFAFGFWGAIGGVFAGVIMAGSITPKSKSKPPEVQVVPPPVAPPTDDSVANKLAALKKLYDQDLLTAEEFASKKKDILAKF